MRFIKEHKLISTLILVIVVTFGFLVYSLSSTGSGNFLTDGLTSAGNFFVKPVNKAGNSVSKNVNGAFSYKELLKENEKLKKENEDLKQQVINLTLTDNQLKSLEDLKGVLNYKTSDKELNIVSADVVSIDSTNWMNVFTINRGTESGIEAGHVVIAGEGLVGKVTDAGKGWAKVSTIIDQNIKVSFKLKGNLDLIGVSNDVEKGRIQGFMLDSSAKIESGEQLITSGMGEYPEGIDVGTITRTKYDKDRHLLTVTIKPAVDFTSLQKVSVIL